LDPSPDPIEDKDLKLEYKPGEMIGDHFTVIGKLGQGGFGAVYKATTPEPECKTIAVKVGTFKDDDLDFATNEFDRMYQLKSDSPNGVPSEYCLDVEPQIIIDLVPGRPINFFSFGMEFIEGQDLFNFTVKTLQHLPDTEKQEAIQHLMLEIAKNLQYFTDNSVAHFDIKPENIMITPDLKVKIVDYGLMREPDHATGKGTLLFMSPEILEGQVDEKGFCRI